MTTGGSEFTFRYGTGSRHGRVATFSHPGRVLTVHTSGPDRVGVGTGQWELVQEAGDVYFALA